MHEKRWTLSVCANIDKNEFLLICFQKSAPNEAKASLLLLLLTLDDFMLLHLQVKLLFQEIQQ